MPRIHPIDEVNLILAHYDLSSQEIQFRFWLTKIIPLGKVDIFTGLLQSFPSIKSNSCQAFSLVCLPLRGSSSCISSAVELMNIRCVALPINSEPMATEGPSGVWYDIVVNFVNRFLCRPG